MYFMNRVFKICGRGVFLSRLNIEGKGSSLAAIQFIYYWTIACFFFKGRGTTSTQYAMKKKWKQKSTLVDWAWVQGFKKQRIWPSNPPQTIAQKPSLKIFLTWVQDIGEKINHLMWKWCHCVEGHGTTVVRGWRHKVEGLGACGVKGVALSIAEGVFSGPVPRILQSFRLVYLKLFTS